MRIRQALLAILLFTASGLARQLYAQGRATQSAPKYESWKALRPTDRFEGVLTLKTRDGRTLPLRVRLRTWGIDRGFGPQKLNIEEFTLFQLRAGEVKTVIRDNQQERKVEEFWSLPAGSVMSLEVKGEAAILETLALSRP